MSVQVDTFTLFTLIKTCCYYIFISYSNSLTNMPVQIKTVPGLVFPDEQNSSDKTNNIKSTKRGAMQRGLGTCTTLKPFNLTYLNVLHSQIYRQSPVKSPDIQKRHENRLYIKSMDQCYGTYLGVCSPLNRPRYVHL